MSELDPIQLSIITNAARISDANFSHGWPFTQREAEEALHHRNVLLDHVAELTRQRDDARALAIESGAFTATDEYGVQRLDAKGNPLYGVDIYAGRESAEKVINTPRYRLGAARIVHRTVTEWVAIEAGAFL
jgi:hypothetical protein